MACYCIVKTKANLEQEYQLSQYNKELEKFTNQARFVQMIIDGKLVVSKKKKKDLVAELKQKGFRAFSKTIDASKDGENEPVVENDEVDDETVEAEANSYDYLLGMAIWSLTKERVEKLLRQIGDKELEIDALIKLSKEDLWKKDLDEFINEWRFQLEDEEKRQRKVASMGRRVSLTLKTQVKPLSKKRKGDDSFSDSDFAGKKQKKAPTVVKKVQPKGGMLSHLSPPSKPKQTTLTTIPNGVKLLSETSSATEPKIAEKEYKDVQMTIDGAEDSDAPIAPVAAKGKSGAATKKAPPAKASKPTKIDSDSDDEPVVKAVPASRAPRAAARKPVKYSLNSDSDSDSGDDLLLDVGKMVKGIGSTTVPTAAGPSTTRPLFSATASLSRPGSSAGLVARKSLARTIIESGSEDETDYTRLAPPTSGGVKATARATVLSDDDDDMEDFVTKPAAVVNPAAAAPKPRAKAPSKAAAAKPAAKAAAAVKEKEQKKLPLSPAAKAYAAKQAKANAATSSTAAGKAKAKPKSKPVSSDEGDDFDDIKGVGVGKGREASVASSETGSVVGGRPARRAAAAAVKKTWVIDDDDEDEEEDAEVASEESEDFEESE